MVKTQHTQKQDFPMLQALQACSNPRLSCRYSSRRLDFDLRPITGWRLNDGYLDIWATDRFRSLTMELRVNTLETFMCQKILENHDIIL